MNEVQVRDRYPRLEPKDFLAVYQYAALIVTAHDVVDRLPALQARVEQELPPTASVSSRLASIPRVETSRPLEDKLLMAAGRAIVRALKSGMTPKEIEAEAFQTARKLAKQYKMSGISESVKHRIMKKLQDRVPGYELPN